MTLFVLRMKRLMPDNRPELRALREAGNVPDDDDNCQW